MKIAKRARRQQFWQCIWVARRWMEIKSLEWDLMMEDITWLSPDEKAEFEEACTDIQIATGQMPSLHKNILLGD